MERLPLTLKSESEGVSYELSPVLPSSPAVSNVLIAQHNSMLTERWITESQGGSPITHVHIHTHRRTETQEGTERESVGGEESEREFSQRMPKVCPS